MNDSQQEGFYEPVIETVTQCICKSETHQQNAKNLQLKLKPPLCVHYQLTLFQYPQEMDQIGNLQDEKRISSTSQDAIAVTSKKQESTPLNEYFPRNYQCIYNKFREKLTFKRDLTLIIRNVTRQIRDEQLNTFDSNQETSNAELSFSSDFQCGNLHFVFKERKQQVYYLLLQNDVNTHGYNFWFFFNVRAAITKKCTFIIVNLSRPVSFQNEVCILTYSKATRKLQRKIGFFGESSQFSRCDSQQNYWSLQFQYDFEQGSDVYFSLILPYSYSKAIKFLKGLGSNSKNHSFLIDTALKSPLGNAIPIIKIERQHRRCKRLILITARQHPSETVGSFVCESIIRILCSKNRLSDKLLQRLKFIVIPMINVDGVIHGNSRTNLLGYDLNRCWDRAGIIQASECQQIWKYLQAIQSQGSIVWSFDLHGHSREHGFFAYFSQKSQKNLIMTHYLAKNKMFRPNKCVYQIGSSKRESIRGQLYQRKKIKNATTIQISLFGSYDQEQKFFHYSSNHFDEIATSILQSLFETQRLSQKRLLKQKNWQQIIQKMGQTQQNDKETDSDSNPEGDYLKQQQRKQVQQSLVQSKIQQRQKSASRNRIIHNEQKRFKTQLDQKCDSQRTSPILKRAPLNIHGKKNEKSKSSQEKSRMKNKKNDLFNLTFTSRFHSSSKVFIQSQQFYSQPKITKVWYEDKPKQKQFRLSPARFQPEHLQQSANLKKSLDMRRRIKMAFQRRQKTQRDTHTRNLIGPSNATKIQPMVYPTLKEKDMLELHNNLKSKRELTKQLRNQSYGISMQSNRFQNSFYLKNRNP